MLKQVSAKVSGVAPQDRNFFGGLVQTYLAAHERIDLRIDWSGGDEGTKNIKVVVDCCEFTCPRVIAGIRQALADTWMADPRIEPRHNPAKALIAA